MPIFGSFSSDECVTAVAQRILNRTSRMPELGTYGSVGGPAPTRRAAVIAQGLLGLGSFAIGK
jgi:hypothetical protein